MLMTLVFNVSHLEQVLVIRKSYIYYIIIVIIYHNTFQRSMMEKENLGLWNELLLSSIPALHALGSIIVKRGQKYPPARLE